MSAREQQPRDAVVMRRRELLWLLGGAAVWTGTARAEDGRRRIGVLMSVAEADPEAPLRRVRFFEGLAAAGFEEPDLEVIWRWVQTDPSWMDTAARELASMGVDVLVGSATPQTAALLEQTSDKPVVFGLVADPVDSGFADSLAHPGHNATGFINFEASLAGKWVDLMREAVPGVSVLTMMFNPRTAVHEGEYFYGPFEEAAVQAGLQVGKAPVDTEASIGPAVAAIAEQPRAALVVAPDVFVSVHRAEIIAATARHRVPALYAYRYNVVDGGLMSYGIDTPDVFRLMGGYVGRVLQGADPAELPVQAPTKFQLVINQRTAEALGLSLPPTLLARADEVIE